MSDHHESAPRSNTPSSLVTALLSGAIALCISAAAYVFGQGQLQAGVAELTRRITSLEQNTASHGDIADIDRRISTLEASGSPALGALRTELEADGRRLQALEQNITQSIKVNADQDQRSATIETRQQEVLRRLQIIEADLDRLTTLATNLAVLQQQVTDVRNAVGDLQKWRDQERAEDRDVAVQVSRIEVVIKAVTDQLRLIPPQITVAPAPTSK